MESHDKAPFNAGFLETVGVIIWNEPAEVSAVLGHYGNTVATPPSRHSFTLAFLSITFNSNECFTW